MYGLQIGGLLDGRPLTAEAHALKACIGLVSRDLTFYPTLSAWDNVLFFGGMYGLWGGKRLRRRAEVEATRRLRERRPEARVIILITFDDNRLYRKYR